MTVNYHDLGDLVRVSAVFKDALLDTVMDPDIVKLSLKAPGEDVVVLTYGTDITVIKDSTGNYHCDVDASVVGSWYYRWWSTGDGQAAEEKRFVVRAANAV